MLELPAADVTEFMYSSRHINARGVPSENLCLRFVGGSNELAGIWTRPALEMAAGLVTMAIFPVMKKKRASATVWITTATAKRTMAWQHLLQRTRMEFARAVKRYAAVIKAGRNRIIPRFPGIKQRKVQLG